MWTTYSMINSTCKGKYGDTLKKFPRVTSLLKAYDTDVKKKAAVFSKDDLDAFVDNSDLSTPYWLVRKVVVILAFFGGLRHCESMDLKLERFSACPDGVYVTHARAKQRSDKTESKFLIPRAKTHGETDFASIIELYLHAIKEDLGKFSGRVFWTGRQLNFVDVPVGRNIIGKVPHEMATYLKKPNVAEFTFHSFRRSSATAAADSGATPQQMIDFYGWSNVSMPQEYITTSKAAVKNMAANLNHVEDKTENKDEQVEEQKVEQEDSKNKKLVLYDWDSGDFTGGRLIQNNQKVIFIQNFNGTIN
jgi:integrase